MPKKRKPDHALFVRWREFEIGAFGVPAIAAVIVITIFGARWLGLL